MQRINLRDYYPFFHSDNLIDVADEIALALKNFDLQEQAYRLRRYRHKAYYSLDRDEGIEHDILLISISPSEIYERKIIRRKLYSAFSALPDNQAKRIYAYFFLEMSKCEIAAAEGVDESTIRKSIQRGLGHMKRFLKK
jgi:RNA polymerase sigma-70 factor, ECF subfamily